MTDLVRRADLAPDQIVIARMEMAREQLAEARNVHDAKRVADAAAGVCEWLRRQTDLGLEIVNDGLLLKLQAEGRMGEFLSQPGVVKGDGRPAKPSMAVTVSRPTHKDLGLSRESARRFREVATIPPDTLRTLAAEATRTGRELTRESVLKVARRLKPAAPAETNGNGADAPLCAAPIPDHILNAVTTGDARLLASGLPDESVALCIADPVYDRVADYRWLAAECERVLVPGGNLIVQSGNLRRFECEQAMRESALDFVDLLAEVYPYALGRLFPSKVFIGWKPHLWFSKGRRLGEWAMNRVMDKGKPHAEEAKALHPWGDGEFLAVALLAKLCPAGGLVWDPFTGSGTIPVVAKRLGFPFVAFEIDADRAEDARQRIAGTRRQETPQQILDLMEAAA